MAGKQPWRFLDKFHHEITPRTVRVSLSGNVHLGYDVMDIPPAGAKVDVRVTAIVMPPHLVAEGEDGLGPYHALVPLKAREAHDLVIVVPEAEPADQVQVDDLLPEGVDTTTIELTISRDGEKGGPEQSAAKARAASRKARAPRGRTRR